MWKSEPIMVGCASPTRGTEEMLVPLHLKHKSPAGASACQPVIHRVLEWVGVERRRKRDNVHRCSLGLSVRPWAGRVAERAEQAPGMSSVGVGVGREGGGGPKWQSGFHVWELTVNTYTCPAWLCSVIMDSATRERSSSH